MSHSSYFLLRHIKIFKSFSNHVFNITIYEYPFNGARNIVCIKGLRSGQTDFNRFQMSVLLFQEALDFHRVTVYWHLVLH